MRAIKTTTISILALGLLAGSAVGVAAQSVGFAGSMDTGCTGLDSGAERCSGTIEVSDDRISGEVEFTVNWVESELSEGGAFAIFGPSDIAITNDGGSWAGQGVVANIVEGDEPEEQWVWVLTGEGGYEGLSAVLNDRLEEADGAIIEGAFPSPAE